MDRSPAARAARPFAGPTVPRRSRTSKSRTTGAGGAGSLRRLPLICVGALVRLIRTPLLYAWQRPRGRIALLAVLGCLPLLAGGWILLRQSPFVSVQHVHVTGLHGAQSGAIDGALVAAARRMSTLDVNRGALRAAVAGYPVVRQVIAKPKFPHGLSIRVIEQPPVATLVVGSSRTAVAADGAVLGPALASSSLPIIGGYRELSVGQHVDDPGLRGILAVLGAAPAPMERVTARVYVGPRGLTLEMRNGLLAYFGDAARPHAKWLSLDRVLADSSSQGASYVDVRIPGRPAAGFPAGVTPPAQSASGASSISLSASSSETTVASIAASLAGSNNGTSSITPSGTESASGTTASTTEAGDAPAETPAAPTAGQAEAATESSQTTAVPGG